MISHKVYYTMGLLFLGAATHDVATGYYGMAIVSVIWALVNAYIAIDKKEKESLDNR